MLLWWIDDSRRTRRDRRETEERIDEARGEIARGELDAVSVRLDRAFRRSKAVPCLLALALIGCAAVGSDRRPSTGTVILPADRHLLPCREYASDTDRISISRGYLAQIVEEMERR